LLRGRIDGARICPQPATAAKIRAWLEIDQLVGYCVIVDVLRCLARPLVVGSLVFAVLLEGLQAFMPDRSSYYLAAVYSAAGVLTAALVAELFVGAWRRFRSKRAVSAQPSSAA
jgi:hypothetical protein